jgi:hypothetical protein
MRIIPAWESHKQARGRSGRLPPFLLWGMGVLALLILGHLLAADAEAHERRTVGNYVISVGFRDEPPIAGYPNALELMVSQARTGEPVTGLEGTLRLELLSAGGAQRRELVPLPIVREPGRYTTEPFILTRAEEYVIRIVGQVREQRVDERFPTEAVVDPSQLRFPPSAGLLEGRGNDLPLALSAAAIALGLLGAGTGLYALLRVRRRGPTSQNRHGNGAI